MAKLTQKQTYNQIREKVSRQFNDKLSEKEDTIRRLTEENSSLKQQNQELTEKLRAAEEQLRQSAEWLDRMQEYCNLTQADMEEVRKSLKSSNESREAVANLSQVFGFMERFISPIYGPMSSIMGNAFTEQTGEDTK